MTPKEKKYLNYGVYGAVAIGALYLIFGSKTESGGGSADPTGNGSVSPGNFEFNAATVANQLYNAMKDTGTKTNLIFSALANVSQDNFAKVITAFGKRSYNDTFGNQINFGIFPLPLHGLVYWLESELSEEHYETLRQKYPKYL